MDLPTLAQGLALQLGREAARFVSTVRISCLAPSFLSVHTVFPTHDPLNQGSAVLLGFVIKLGAILHRNPFGVTMVFTDSLLAAIVLHHFF